MNKIHLSLSALGVMACLSMPVSAAIYFGTDTSGGAVDTSTLDWTFEATNPGTPAGGADVGKTDGTKISESHLLDGNDDHSSINGTSAAPLGFGNNWGNPAPDSIVWTMDMKQYYDVHKIIMQAGSGNGYYSMTGTSIEASVNGADWTKIGSTAGEINSSGQPKDQAQAWTQNAQIKSDVSARYLRVTVSGFSNSGPVKLDQMNLYVTPASSVPEPGSLSLGTLMLGGLLFAGGRRRVSQ